jgi:tetratricopeptide (TPR) repeat protein
VPSKHKETFFAPATKIFYISATVEPIVWQEGLAMTKRDRRFSRFWLLLGCAIALVMARPVTTHAVIIDNPASEAEGDAEFRAAEWLVKERQFQEALPLLKRVVARDPGNADAYNYLAFSQRKIGLLDEAMSNYMRALDLDPEHIGAREYLGELYLQLGQRDKAEEQLAILVRLCPLGCEAREDLAQAIAESKRRRSP